MPRFRATTIYTDSTTKIIAVESLSSYRSADDHRCQLYGTLRPVAVVVCAFEDVVALGMDGREIDVARLTKEIPSLASAVSSWQADTRPHGLA